MTGKDVCCRTCADEYTLRHVIIQCPVCGKTDCSKAYNHTNPCVWSGVVPGVTAGMIDNLNPQMDDRTDLRAKLQAAEAALNSLVDLTQYSGEPKRLLSDPLMVAVWVKEGIDCVEYGGWREIISTIKRYLDDESGKR